MYREHAPFDLPRPPQNVAGPREESCESMHGSRAAQSRLGTHLAVTKHGEALLEGQLEPVAARDAVARPVVEVLVRNHPLHPLEVGVGGCAPRAPATPVRPGRPAPKAGELSLEPRKPCKYKQCRMLAMPVHRQTKTKSTLSLSPSPIMHGDTSCAARIARRPSLSGSRRPRPLGAPARPRTVGVPVSVCVATRHARLPISPQSCMDGEGCVCVRVRGGQRTRLGLGEDARGVEDVEALVLHRCRAQAQRGQIGGAAAGAARGRDGFLPRRRIRRRRRGAAQGRAGPWRPNAGRARRAFGRARGEVVVWRAPQRRLPIIRVPEWRARPGHCGRLRRAAEGHFSSAQP